MITTPARESNHTYSCVDTTNGGSLVSAASFVSTTSLSFVVRLFFNTVPAGNYAIIGIGVGSLYMGIGGPGGGTAGTLYLYSNTGTQNALQVLAAKKWYTFGVTLSTTATVGYSLPDRGSLTVVSAAAAGTFTDAFRVSNDQFGNSPIPGLISNLKIFNYPMSRNEMLMEMLQLEPVSQRGQLSYLKFRTNQSSGQDMVLPGRVWTKTGNGVTVQMTPPLPEILQPRSPLYFLSKSAQQSSLDVIGYGCDF